ncbi:MAG: KpsF/GutQ family sugar-phosphate isomerase [Thermodesulfobacteriota bacterium]
MNIATETPSEMVIRQAREVLKSEAEGVLQLMDRIDDNFARMVEVICGASGRLIVAGIGKSGIIGRKFVATFNSTGTRSLFLHPVEAMHGDLGMVGPEDVVLALSNSGETEELNILIPTIRSMGCRVIAFTGNPRSTLACNSDIVIDVGVEREACPMGLAPTTSTTALLAMGDALAVVLIHKKHFKSVDFKRFHPGGALGKRLSKQVRDFMMVDEAIPMVFENAAMADALSAIDQAGIGVVLIVDEARTLTGILTDGDLRRLLARRQPIYELSVRETMVQNPKSVGPNTPAYDALNLMEAFEITVLPIVDADMKVIGILHLHDILGKGEFKFKGA